VSFCISINIPFHNIRLAGHFEQGSYCLRRN